MDKRNKFWRRQQMARIFKARMILYAAYGIVSSVRMEVIMNILIGLSWPKRNVHKFTRLPGHRVVVGCAEVWNMTVRSTKKKLYRLLGNQWSTKNR